ncbi:MAG: DNA translocase FtsK 4TM domain-containing protein, partial [Desulfovibrio sp.]|nr:DNA translocase FtsK 4TM domain-containing protein [Desulfovibrio sp.]
MQSRPPQEEQKTQRKGGYARELTGLFLFFWAIFLLLCLVSFDRNDTTLNQVSSVAQIHNKAGQFGAYVAGFLNEWFGLCAFLWPIFFVSLGCSCVSRRLVLNFKRWLGIFLLVLFLLETSAAWQISTGDFSPGGIVGHGLYACVVRYLNPLGASLLWLFIFMVALQLILNISWFELLSRLGERLKRKAPAEQPLSSPSSPLFTDQDNQGQSPSLFARMSGFLGRFKQDPRPAEESQNQEAEQQGKVKKKSKKSQKQEQKPDEPLFQPPEDLFKEKPDDDDILGLNKKKEEKAEALLAEPPSDLPLDQKIEPSLEPLQQAQKEPTDIERRSKAEAKVEAEVKAKAEAEEEVEVEEEEEAPKEEHQLKEPKTAPKSGFSQTLKQLFRPAEKKEQKEETKVVKPKRPKIQGSYPLPPLSLLTAPEPSPQEQEDYREKARVLMQTLSEFSIGGELTAVTPGPVVT